MTPDEKYKAKKRKEYLNEKYLEKQLCLLARNKIEILMKVKLLKTKHSTKPINSNKIFISDRQLIKLLAVNSRTAQLLRGNVYIRFFFLNGYVFYKLIDIESFLKSLSKSQFS